jgi:hypothetical protein
VLKSDKDSANAQQQQQNNVNPTNRTGSPERKSVVDIMMSPKANSLYAFQDVDEVKQEPAQDDSKPTTSEAEVSATKANTGSNSNDANSPAHLSPLSSPRRSSVSGSEMSYDKCIVVENHSSRIKAMSYSDNLELLSVGLANGQIVNYQVQIENFNQYLDDSDD